ncbi:hypothetical protein LWF01_11620 [Saxibacter everestensis]|uniref:Integral membrane protein n=1 Tax=Saxibacter everestensis TaxID=2909229 RepID=A0ABY8QP87_9MICO|nr:hypothetical protein LWF01_11620 [Brevibacteriaceae bacterium ZFBP1038]
MTILSGILLVLHFIGLAAIIGSWLTVLKAPRVVPGMLHGALLQLISGLGLVGVLEASDADVNHAKIAVKLVIAIVITILAFVGVRRLRKAAAPAGADQAVAPAPSAVNTALLGQLCGVLAVVNVVIAVFW